MGGLFSGFRKKEKEETTLDKLNKIESRIKSLEEHIQQDRRKEKRTWFWFLLIAGFLYVSIAGACHMFILERTTVLDYAKLVLMWITPLFLIYFLQRWIPWYFERGIQDNRDKLRKLREEKKKILDDVRENEPYNKAKAILEKFEGPQALPPRPAAAAAMVRPAQTPVRPPGPAYQKFPVGPMPPRMPAGAVRGPQPGGYIPQPGRFAVPQPELGYGRPPVPRQRSTFDRMLDYVVKDGPENRMALICRNCGAHNGLVMLDEFEYTDCRQRILLSEVSEFGPSRILKTGRNRAECVFSCKIWHKSEVCQEITGDCAPDSGLCGRHTAVCLCGSCIWKLEQGLNNSKASSLLDPGDLAHWHSKLWNGISRCFRCFECRAPNPSRKPRPSVSSISNTPNMSPSTMTLNRISGSESESSSSGEEENLTGPEQGDTVHQAVTKTPVTIAKLEAVPVATVETVSAPHLSDGDTGSESDNEEDEAQNDGASSSAPLLSSPEVPDQPAVVA